MTLTTIIIFLSIALALPLIVLLVGWVLYKRIKREQEVQSRIAIPDSAENGEDGKRIANKLRKEKLRKEL